MDTISAAKNCRPGGCIYRGAYQNRKYEKDAKGVVDPAILRVDYIDFTADDWRVVNPSS